MKKISIRVQDMPMENCEFGKYKFICFTAVGRELMARIIDELSKNEEKNQKKILGTSDNENRMLKLSEWTSENFVKGNILVFIGALGIAVRAIAPLCKDKTTDPGVLVIDENGTFVIPVLSGHIGGAVEAARKLSALIGAVPVITTASDVRNEFAVDVFAVKNEFAINDMKKAKEFSARLISGEEVEFVVTPKSRNEGKLCLIPKCVVAGMGCRKGKSFEQLYDFLMEELERNGIDRRALKAVVSADKKKDEMGLIELAAYLDIPYITYSAEVLMQQQGNFEHSDLVMEVTGADNVCERAVAAFGCKKLLLKKTSMDGMTLALGLTDIYVVA